jgi:PEP-CTERM motif
MTVPEPSTWAMLLLGFAGLGLCGLSQSEGVARRIEGGPKGTPICDLQAISLQKKAPCERALCNSGSCAPRREAP